MKNIKKYKNVNKHSWLEYQRKGIRNGWYQYSDFIENGHSRPVVVRLWSKDTEESSGFLTTLRTCIAFSMYLCRLRATAENGRHCLSCRVKPFPWKWWAA